METQESPKLHGLRNYKYTRFVVSLIVTLKSSLLAGAILPIFTGIEYVITAKKVESSHPQGLIGMYLAMMLVTILLTLFQNFMLIWQLWSRCVLKFYLGKRRLPSMILLSVVGVLHGNLILIISYGFLRFGDSDAHWWFVYDFGRPLNFSFQLAALIAGVFTFRSMAKALPQAWRT